MASRGESQVAEAAERLSGLILESVTQTLQQHSAEPSRVYLGGLLSHASVQSAEEERATELMVTLILVRWLSVARDQVPESSDLVEAVLGWIRENMGPRCAVRAKYTASALRGEEAAPDMMQYRNALRGDFLPSLVWQLAAVVAVYGGGEMSWLRQLVGAPGAAG